MYGVSADAVRWWSLSNPAQIVPKIFSRMWLTHILVLNVVFPNVLFLIVLFRLCDFLCTFSHVVLSHAYFFLHTYIYVLFPDVLFPSVLLLTVVLRRPVAEWQVVTRSAEEKLQMWPWDKNEHEFHNKWDITRCSPEKCSYDWQMWLRDGNVHDYQFHNIRLSDINLCQNVYECHTLLESWPWYGNYQEMLLWDASIESAEKVQLICADLIMKHLLRIWLWEGVKLRCSSTICLLSWQLKCWYSSWFWMVV